MRRGLASHCEDFSQMKRSFIISHHSANWHLGNPAVQNLVTAKKNCNACFFVLTSLTEALHNHPRGPACIYLGPQERGLCSSQLR